MSEMYSGKRFESNGDDLYPVHANGNGVLPPHAEPEQNSIREFFGLLRRHWLVVSGVVFLCTLAAAYKAYTDPPEFRSTAVVRMADTRRMLAGNLAGPAAGASALGDPIQSQIEILKSRSVTGMVVDDVGLRLVPLDVEFPYRTLFDVEVDPSTPIDTVRLVYGAEGYEMRTGVGNATARYGEPVQVAGVTLTAIASAGEEVESFIVIPRESAAEGLQRGLMAERRDRTDLIDVGYTAHDPILSQRIVEAAVGSFQAFNAGTAQGEARRRREFIEGQLAHTDSLLRDAQLTLAGFRSRERLYSTSAGLTARQAELNGLALERDQMLADREVYSQVLNQLGQSEPGTRDEGVRSIISDARLSGSPAVAPYYNQYINYQTAYDSLAASGRSPEHFQMVRVAQQLESARGELLRAIRSYVEGLNDRIRVLNDMVERGEATMEALPTTEAEEVRLLAEVEHLSGVASGLRSEYQQAQIEEAVQAGQITIVDPPLIGESVRAGQIRTVLFGLVLGLMLGGGVAVGLEKANTSIRRKDEVERVLHIPELAVVPGFVAKDAAASRGNRLLPAVFTRNGTNGNGKSKGSFGELVSAAEPHSAAAEAYRTLRTNLIFSQSLHALETIVVTSSAPAEGKSTTAANLAATFAKQGKKVVLVDCDLRKARLHKMFGVPREPGLTHLMLGLKEVGEVVRETKVDNLWFLASGTLPPNPAELVSGEQMRGALDTLKGEFDLVIVDTPPLLAASDAALIGRMVDGVILVVRAGQTERDAARQAVRQLGAGRARVLGAVLNDPDGKVGKYGGHYQYEYYGHKVEA